jgi:hypothetical protein
LCCADQMRLGSPLLKVTVPNTGANDGQFPFDSLSSECLVLTCVLALVLWCDSEFGKWMKSNVALPVGVQACSQPSTRVFAVNCTASEYVRLCLTGT